MRLLSVALELAVNNLRAKRERTILTISSVTLAVIITLLLVSISDRIITSMRHSFSIRKVNIYCFPPQVPIELGPITISSATNYIPFSLVDKIETDAYLMRYSPHVTGVQKMMINYRGYNIPLIVMDLRKFVYFYPQALKHRIVINFIPSEGLEGVAILGYQLGRLFNLKSGDEMILLNKKVLILKVLPKLGSYEDYTIFLDLSSLKLFKVEGAYQLWITFDYPIKGKEKEILKYLKDTYPEYRFYTASQLMNAQLGSAKAVRFLQFAIALVGILIAFTATTNTMLISTYERIREFGILLALGAPRRMVFTSIIAEGIIVSFIGGVMGVLLGLISVNLFEYSIRTLFRFAFPLTGISLSTFIDIIFIIFGLGAFSSLVPAYIASNLKVAQALRWE